MTKKESRKLALELMQEQLMNTGYSLERPEYERLTHKELASVEFEICKILEQFRSRYKL